VTVTAGVDMGSTATKALVLVDGRIAGSTARVTGADPERSGELALREALDQASWPPATAAAPWSWRTSR